MGGSSRHRILWEYLNVVYYHLQEEGNVSEVIRILHVLGNTQLGGAESRIMDLYRQDRKSVV